MDTRAYNLRLGDAVVRDGKTLIVDGLELVGRAPTIVDIDFESGENLVLSWNESVMVREADRRTP